jgi:hypothetical protein
MKNLVGYWANLSRAYEVALLGGLSLRVVFDKEYKAGFEDYEQIKEFFKAVAFSGKGALSVTIYKPSHDIPENRFEALEAIHKRVEAAKRNELPATFEGSACETLLKVATDRLSLSIADRNLILKISGVIGQLSGSECVSVEHLAEAIHYVGYTKDNCNECNAENRTIKFGDGIVIALHELDRNDVKEAIEYLNGL